MNAPPLRMAPTTRAPRSDGLEARARLLYAALALFAEKGFAKTSTRQIALAAGTNIAAISYYFGDKAGLYAATFVEPMGGDAAALTARFADPALSLDDALRIFMAGHVAPLKNGEIARQCMRLHMREMLEPTSQWKTELERDIQGPHEALVAVLCRHLRVPRADDDMHRLAFSVAGLAIEVFVMQDVIDHLRPSLLRTAGRIDTWTDRLVRYALALVASEAQRRSQAPAAPLAERASPDPRRRSPSPRRNTALQPAKQPAS